MRGGINAGGDFKVAGGFLARRSRGGTHDEGRSLSRGKDRQERKTDERNETTTKWAKHETSGGPFGKFHASEHNARGREATNGSDIVLSKTFLLP